MGVLLADLRAADHQPAAAGRVDKLPRLAPLGVLEGRTAGFRAQRLRRFAARRDTIHLGLDGGGVARVATKGRGDDHRALRHLAMAIGVAEVGKRQRAAFARARSEEHTSELQSLMRISYAVFCLKKKKS